MQCRMIELRDKQVVSVKDGCVIGFVCDVEIDSTSGKLVSIVVSGKSRGVGLLSRNEDIVIPWSSIEVIGHDSILVNFDVPLPQTRKRKGLFNSLFYGD